MAASRGFVRVAVLFASAVIVSVVVARTVVGVAAAVYCVAVVFLHVVFAVDAIVARASTCAHGFRVEDHFHMSICFPNVLIFCALAVMPAWGIVSSSALRALPVVSAFQIITAATTANVVNVFVLVDVTLLLVCRLVSLVVAVVVVFAKAKTMLFVVGLHGSLPACRLMSFVVIYSDPNLAFRNKGRFMYHEFAPKMLTCATALIPAHLVRPVWGHANQIDQIEQPVFAALSAIRSTHHCDTACAEIMS